MKTEKKIRNALIKLYWQAHNHGGLAEFEDNISEQLKSKKWADIRASVIGEAMQKIQSAQQSGQSHTVGRISPGEAMVEFICPQCNKGSCDSHAIGISDGRVLKCDFCEAEFVVSIVRTKHAPGVVESAASVSISAASEVSASEVDSSQRKTK